MFSPGRGAPVRHSSVASWYSQVALEMYAWHHQDYDPSSLNELRRKDHTEAAPVPAAPAPLHRSANWTQ